MTHQNRVAVANPALRKLGLSQKDRVAILHADDVGMCQATLAAISDLWEAGLVSSAAAMVPCPWFAQAAALCRASPGVDVGVHLTTTCEYSAYRWGPLSTRDPASGLLAEDGGFHQTAPAAGLHGRPEAALREMEAQVVRAQDAGIDITHIDSHMGTAWFPAVLPGYVELARQFRLPLLLLRPKPPTWRALQDEGWIAPGHEMAALALNQARALEQDGWPLLDNVFMMPLDRPGDRLEQAIWALDSLPPGITHFVLHPAVDTPELRAITPYDWPSRVADYRAFTSHELAVHVRRSDLQVIGYRALRDLVRTA
ncbi:MAG TPA: polysaccharide deacetylase family protein [Anaerolineae bacterium]|nr:polysaccharide deacetylase family protein [Anaerolineae bacterium]